MRSAMEWRSRTFVGIWLALLTTVGCRAHQLQNDQEQMRLAIIDMYTNQVMDNLIRAYNGYPFVQVDYSNVTGTITHEGKGGLSGLFVDAVTATLDGSQNNQLTVSANPVLQDDGVYTSYLKFAGNASTPTETFIVSCEPPPCDSAHICVCRDGFYYWVPKDRAYEFQTLALRTTVMRSTGTAAVQDHYITKIKGLVPTADFEKDSALEKQGKKVTSFDYLIALEDAVPNDQPGHLWATVNGLTLDFTVEKVSPKQLKQIQTTEPINVLRITLQPPEGGQLPVTLDDLQRDFRDLPVKIRLSRSRPPAPQTSEDTLKSIRREMELFRLNQQRVIGR